MICTRTDRFVNQGEQILFHFQYPHGGYFDVLEAGPAQVTVNPADPRNQGTLTGPHIASDRAESGVAGSRARRSLGAVRFVGQGRRAVSRGGRGRSQTESDRVQLDRPWRVVPDRSSRVTLTVAYRQEAFCVGDSIDAGFIDAAQRGRGDSIGVVSGV